MAEFYEGGEDERNTCILGKRLCEAEIFHETHVLMYSIADGKVVC